MALMDMEFEKLRTMMPHVALNTMAAREHVREAERKIRVIKEKARGTFNTLPYKKLPKLMVPREVWDIQKMEPTGVGI